MLTYMEVHLYYTLPVLGILFALLRPFHSPKDRFKYIFLCSVAFLTASPWDNYIVYHKAWWYCPTCVTALIGYVPLEEYMFFIIMSLMTVAFSNLVMRWRLPSVFLKPETPAFQSMCVRFLPVMAFLALTIKAWVVAIPGTPLFYGACIVWYVCPVLAFLWFGAGEYICRRWKAVLPCIIIPTVYLCWVDRLAIAAGTWHISRRTSTGHMIVPDLPLEEFMFFTLINVVLVFANCAVDRALAIVHLQEESTTDQEDFSFNQRVVKLLWAFFQPDQSLCHQQLRDLDVTWGILKQASYSFYTVSAVFPVHVRQDLGVLYGFCRATDDLADDETVPVAQRKQQLELARDFVRDLFAADHATIDWTRYEGQLSESCLAAFRAFTRLRPYLEADAVHELLDGYAWDLDRRPVMYEADLVRYSACVASSVGEMCTRIILRHHDTDSSTRKWILARARDMGLVLQFTNIARDIVTDSQSLGRCYLPQEWLTQDEYDLIVCGSARKLGDDRLRELALRLIYAATEMAQRARRGIQRLPEGCQGGVYAACSVYSAIGDALKEATGYPTRAYVSGLKRAWIALKNVYGFGQLHFPTTANTNTSNSIIPHKPFIVE